MYTKIEHTFWTDRETRNLSAIAKLVFLYVLSCKHRNIIGLYNLPAGYAIYDLNVEPKQYDIAMAELAEVDSVCFDSTNDIVLINNYLKYNPLESPTQITSAIKCLAEIPATPLMKNLISILETCKKLEIKPLIEALNSKLDTLSYTPCHRVSHTPYHTPCHTNNNNSNNINIQKAISVAETFSLSPGTAPEKPTKEKNEKISTKKVQELLDEYHEILPMLPKIQILSSAAIVNAKILLAEFGEEFIINTFKDITTQKWLHGGNNNDTGWAPDFGWLMVKDNFAKVVNGVYKRLSQKSEKPQTKYERDMAALDAMINAGTEQEEIIDLGVINND